MRWQWYPCSSSSACCLCRCCCCPLLPPLRAHNPREKSEKNSLGIGDCLGAASGCVRHTTRATCRMPYQRHPWAPAATNTRFGCDRSACVGRHIPDAGSGSLVGGGWRAAGGDSATSSPLSAPIRANGALKISRRGVALPRHTRFGYKYKSLHAASLKPTLLSWLSTSHQQHRLQVPSK